MGGEVLGAAPMSDMPTQPITYQGRIRAICTPRRVFLTAPPETALDDGPFVLAMCLYAGAVLNGHVPAPYREIDARAFARALLIPPELLERPLPCPEQPAIALGVPVHEPPAAHRARSVCQHRR